MNSRIYSILVKSLLTIVIEIIIQIIFQMPKGGLLYFRRVWRSGNFGCRREGESGVKKVFWREYWICEKNMLSLQIVRKINV